MPHRNVTIIEEVHFCHFCTASWSVIRSHCWLRMTDIVTDGLRLSVAYTACVVLDMRLSSSRCIFRLTEMLLVGKHSEETQGLINC